MMKSYAQTNVQLLNQLRRDNFCVEHLSLINNSYKLAASLLTGRFQHSGKTTIAHFVGTASILGFLNVPAQVVAAGLLHAIYSVGDFGDGIRGVTQRKRDLLRQTVGDDVEIFAARYSKIKWNKHSIPTLLGRIDELNSTDRQVVLLHLADHLEHHLDQGILHYGASKLRGFMACNAHLPAMIEIAEKLGHPVLAGELERVIEDALDKNIPANLPNQAYWNKHNRHILPRSYRKRGAVWLRRKAIEAKRWGMRAARRYKRILR
jgi:(p)ppGpp synthase/HD superfamily hydrolase